MTRDIEPIASVSDLVVEFRQGTRHTQALRGISLDLFSGETLGIVGESGSGKTSFGRALLGLLKPTAGSVTFQGSAVTGRGSARRLRGRLQVVLQNPDWSLDPTHRVWRSVSEPLVISQHMGRTERKRIAAGMLVRVGLRPEIAHRHPHELSGGQRQRVAIARAMITNPQLIVFDESVTALDPSVQTQVLNLIRDLQEERQFAAVFISHDLAAVRYVSHRIAVFKNGELVELAQSSVFYGIPDHPYSRQLVATLPKPEDGA